RPSPRPGKPSSGPTASTGAISCPSSKRRCRTAAVANLAERVPARAGSRGARRRLMTRLRRRRAGSLCALALVAVVVPLGAFVNSVAPSGEAAASRRPQAALDRLPLAFEANQGQVDPSVQFLARSPGYQVLLTGAGLVVAPSGAGGATVGVTLDGARPDVQAV